MHISEMVEQAYATANAKGWHGGADDVIPTKLVLIHAEVSEALEEYRDGHPLDVIRTNADGKPEGFLSEMADVVIRVADLCGRYGLNLEGAIELKMKYNETRPHRHGGKVC